MRQRIGNLEEFKTLQEACIRARENEKRKVLVCCGTGCAAGGNLKVFDELKAQMDAQGVPCEIALNLTECGGSVTGLKNPVATASAKWARWCASSRKAGCIPK